MLVPIFEVTKSIKFCAAHMIEGHLDAETGGPGKCSRLHGHNYDLTVAMCSATLLPIGYLIDYYWMGKIMKDIEKRWDHQYLNELPDFKGYQTSAEVIAMLACRLFQESLIQYAPPMAAGAKVAYVECKETDGTCARYIP